MTGFSIPNNVYSLHVIICRHGLDTTRHAFSEAGEKMVPFSFTIDLPPPLKTGVDYGFRPQNVSG